MSACRENIERVRKALPTRADEHHNLCNTRHKKPCDCYARQTAPAHAALDALTAQMEGLEQALRLATWDLACHTFHGKDVSLGEEAEQHFADYIARAARAHSDPPEDSE